MANIYKAVNDLIVKYTTYGDDVIFKNYYNNVPLPKPNHFCIMFVLYNRPQMALLRQQKTPNVGAKTSSTDYTQLNDTHMQVDFYGEEAMDQSQKFTTVLQSPLGTNFLNSLGYTVRTCNSPEQIGDPLDRDNYVERYIVKFSLFSNSTITDTLEAFDAAIVNPILVETL